MVLQETNNQQIKGRPTLWACATLGMRIPSMGHIWDAQGRRREREKEEGRGELFGHGEGEDFMVLGP